MAAPSETAKNRTTETAGNEWSTRASASRLAAVQGLYEMELSGASVDDIVLEQLRHRWADAPDDVEPGTLAEPDPVLFKIIVMGTTSQTKQLDEMISSALDRDHGLARLDAVLRAILRAAVFELSQRTETPVRVVFDEYVELAKSFYEGREPDLVNGILDRLGRVLRPAEMDGPQGDRATN